MKKKTLPQFNVLITAGPTQEPLDPVRFLSNSSSGAMGYDCASVFQKRGAKVTLISGPTTLPVPLKVKFISVQTAVQMFKAVKNELKNTDVFISTAAVSDFRFKKILHSKIKKDGRKSLDISLISNPDILFEVGKWKKTKNKIDLLLVGFALESKNIEGYALKKLQTKNLDLIIGNTPETFGKGFIKPYWLGKNEKGFWLEKMKKDDLANRLVKWVLNKKNV